MVPHAHGAHVQRMNRRFVPFDTGAPMESCRDFSTRPALNRDTKTPVSVLIFPSATPDDANGERSDDKKRMYLGTSES